ncbi:RCC1 domain-containing protein [Salinispora tropica]|uniref:Regulator of chromosome condensation, RCC1 n=1 Tax=Salinispora tropica (strain ATCC BAA-916 / DSM 44818 / JCM 13857 / NBRC 105044 / CNB-440) TaxID=369723 RepID=A4X6D4_SALTO|nr:Ig-like domain repeat protein [Salinispora tropica]ABP54434.1 regulator of chromosome condensation, RCC1 [Salinispora tropica CNB-440]
MMQGLCPWVVRGAGACGVVRVLAGWLFLALAVTVTQALGTWPAIAQSGLSSSVVVSDTVLAWGDNFSGQLGDGTTTARSTPVTVGLPAGTTITALAAGGSHSLALTDTGVVLAWGSNSRGQLGDGTTTDRSTPVTVGLPAGTTITALAAGRRHSLALTDTGAVLAWGSNSNGQLGDGTTTARSTPVTVGLPAGTTITALAASTYSLALTDTGAALAWGSNSRGQLGDGTTTDRSTPVTVSLPAGTTITALAASYDHSLALTDTGAVLAWGSNSNGQLGDGTTTNRSTPVTVGLPAGTTITALAAGRSHTLVLTSAGAVLAWGSNSNGQLGDGTTTDRSTPVTVGLPAGTTITALAAGYYHSLALTDTGAVLAWGGNSYGQLGDGTTTDRSTPVTVGLPAGTTITVLVSMDNHGMALVAPPTSTTTLQVTPANPAADQDVTLTATVTCTTDTPTGTITFRTGTTTLAVVPLTTNATHTTTLPAGTHTLTANYTSTNTCPNSQSPPISITIAPPPDEPDLPITGPNLPTTIGAATLLTLTGATLIHLTHRRRPTNP